MKCRPATIPAGSPPAAWASRAWSQSTGSGVPTADLRLGEGEKSGSPSLQPRARVVWMNFARAVSCLFLLLLTSCSGPRADEMLPPVNDAQPSLTEDIVRKGIVSAVNEAHLTEPLEISSMRPSNNGLATEFLCLRQKPPASTGPRAVFFGQGKYQLSRLSVIMEECERQTYIPFKMPPRDPSNKDKARAAAHGDAG